MGPLVIWFFLAIVQGSGGHGMTFGTQEECVATRTQATNDPSVMFISEWMPVTVPKENKT